MCCGGTVTCQVGNLLLDRTSARLGWGSPFGKMGSFSAQWEGEAGVKGQGSLAHCPHGTELPLQCRGAPVGRGCPGEMWELGVRRAHPWKMGSSCSPPWEGAIPLPVKGL